MDMHPPLSADVAEQLGLEDELALLVLLAVLVRLVVLPADRLLALLAGNVAHDVAARRHVTLARLAGVDVDHVVEEIRLTMLTAEVLQRVRDQSRARRLSYLRSPLGLGRTLGFPVG